MGETSRPSNSSSSETRSEPKSTFSASRMPSVTVGAKIIVKPIDFSWTMTCAAFVSMPLPSVVAKMPDASAPQVPPIPWTPNASSESS